MGSFRDMDRIKEINDEYSRSKTGSYRPLKLALIKEFKKCYWCGVEVIDFIRKLGERTPYNAATVDHLVSRYFRKKGEVVIKVLACDRCNQKRANKENKQLGKNHVNKLKAEEIKKVLMK